MSTKVLSQTIGQILDHGNAGHRVRTSVQDSDIVPQIPLETDSERLQWLNRYIGTRYQGCRFNNFDAPTEKHRDAVATVDNYVRSFADHLSQGKSLVLIGPEGTGKDHLLAAACRAILLGYNQMRVSYRDGLSLFAEFRGAFSSANIASEDSIVDAYTQPHLFAISDPLPPRGQLSEYEQRMLLRIVDRRYRNALPMAITANVATRRELDDRLGLQAAARLCHDAVVVACDWPSYRGKR